MVWAEADSGHHTPGRWLPRYKAADNLGSGTLVTRSLLVAGHHFHHVGTTAGGAPLWPCCLPVMCILKWMYLGGEMEL